MTPVDFASVNVNAADMSENTLAKGLFICLLHVNRIPPHIGLIVEGKYHSLTIKGSEPNVDVTILLKAIQQKKIESVFLKLTPHPVFSIDHLNSMFMEVLKKYPQIRSNEVTCLTPIKDFLNEFYAVNSKENDMIYDLLKRLEANNFILQAYSLNLSLENGRLDIPVYTQEELAAKINNIRNEYY